MSFEEAFEEGQGIETLFFNSFQSLLFEKIYANV
jgi:hypothetical protein